MSQEKNIGIRYTISLTVEERGAKLWEKKDMKCQVLLNDFLPSRHSHFLASLMLPLFISILNLNKSFIKQAQKNEW